MARKKSLIDKLSRIKKNRLVVGAVIAGLVVGFWWLVVPEGRSKFITTGTYTNQSFVCKCLGYEYLEQQGASFNTYWCKGWKYDCRQEIN